MSRVGCSIHNPHTGQRMTFLQTEAETGGRLLRIDCYHPGHSPCEREHVHPRQENRFEVRAGTLTFCVKGEEVRIGPGQRISVPPGTPHYFWNADPTPALYIQEFAPALRIRVFFETAFSLAQAGRLRANGSPGLLELAVLMDDFSEEFRVTHPPAIVQRLMRSVLAPVGRLIRDRSWDPTRVSPRDKAAPILASGSQRDPIAR